MYGDELDDFLCDYQCEDYYEGDVSDERDFSMYHDEIPDWDW